jgi:signal transduction histidine kinase
MNAIQFSYPGGRIWLNVELKQDDQPVGVRNPYVLITVKDEGQGIPADKLDLIFGQFQQADASDTRRQGGAGLGLAICHSVIQQHQGRLWVESTIGQGSTFFLALPMQRVAVQA